MILIYVLVLLAIIGIGLLVYNRFKNLHKENELLKTEMRALATERAIAILADAMPRIAVAKQFYLTNNTIKGRIEDSVRMTKEEVLLALPDLYKRIFEKVDIKQGMKFAADQSKVSDHAKVLDILGYSPKYRNARSSLSMEVED